MSGQTLPLNEDCTPNEPTSQAVAQWLRQHFTEGEALDLLRIAGERWGWTKQLNETGRWLLKGSEDPAA